ncbi:MAG: cupin domain-containing protein [Planctomycetota bacterium]
MTAKNYNFAQLDEIAPKPCPCGQSKRAFTEDPDQIASFHMVEISGKSEKHYHKNMTEIYYILKGQGKMYLDDDEREVKPGSVIMIKAGCRHQLEGDFTIINVPVPAFNPDDEYFD